MIFIESMTMKQLDDLIQKHLKSMQDMCMCMKYSTYFYVVLKILMYSHNITVMYDTEVLFISEFLFEFIEALSSSLKEA